MSAQSERMKKVWADRKAKQAEQPKQAKQPKQAEPVESVKTQPESANDNVLFPDRTVVYSGEEYVSPDPTVLMRDGKRWIPEEHGYRARIRSEETVSKLGMGPYIPVPPEAGISFVGHPLNQTSTKKDGQFGSAVYLGNSALCLCPLEESLKRRKFATNMSDNMVQKQREQADEEAYEHDKGQVGIYRKGKTMDRGYVDSKRKIMVSIPEQIR
jgi:hypothetical protein